MSVLTSQAMPNLFGRLRWSAEGPSIVAVCVLVSAVSLGLLRGLESLAQATVNGLASGVLIAMAAVGISLVYGVMRMVNIAQGDFLAVGAFTGLIAADGFTLPVWAAVMCGTAAGAILGGATELAVWRPLRRRGAGFYQTLLMSLGLAFVIRYSLVLFATNKPRAIAVDTTSTIRISGVYIGSTQLAVAAAGLIVLVALGVSLKRSRIGKKTRALADDLDLAETSGVNAQRIILMTGCVSGALTGAAGVLLAASVGQVTPYVGENLLLALFAAVILGGLGNAYGALVGGVLIGLAQEWSTLVFDPHWKLAMGFLILTVTLIARPEGILSRRTRRG